MSSGKTIKLQETTVRLENPGAPFADRSDHAWGWCFHQSRRAGGCCSARVRRKGAPPPAALEATAFGLRPSGDHLLETHPRARELAGVYLAKPQRTLSWKGPTLRSKSVLPVKG